jgi:hypothetical protein
LSIADFVPDDPMWFEDELDEKELVDGNDEPFRYATVVY